jgi:hypothetical protein
VQQASTQQAAATSSTAAQCQPSEAPQPGEPQTAEQWIDVLVAEMLAARDMGDARARAASVLQHFERFVKQRHKNEVSERNDCSCPSAFAAGAPQQPAVGPLCCRLGMASCHATRSLPHALLAPYTLQGSDARVAELVKENAIYKRAVQIQAGRMQAKAALEEEVTALRGAVAQYQERCTRLEMHAYSLALHLQQATAAGGGPASHLGPNPPDVF